MLAMVRVIPGVDTVNARADARMHQYEEQTRTSGVIYVLMIVVALAFGGFVWQLYGAEEATRIEAPPGPYKVEGSQAAPGAGEDGETSEAGQLETAPPRAAVAATTAVAAPAGTGPYVAQLAALRSEEAVQAAWRRFSNRAPALFGDATMDVQRADLGARGTYYRVRAGYFASRAEAAQFCVRIREMGQDCIAAAR